MPAPTGPYTVEAHYPETGLAADRGNWIVLVNDRLEFCRGFMAARRSYPGVSPALRLVRTKDGHLVGSLPRRDEQGVGMVAGYPTGVQMLDAARRLLSRVQPQRGYVTQEEADLAAAALRVLDTMTNTETT